MILLALLQVAAVTAPPTGASSAPVAPSFSILAEPCARAAGQTVGNDVIVCGRDANVQRLPLPDDRGPPDRAAASNPHLLPDVAHDAVATPCAARQGGCQVGFGQPVIAAAVGGLVTAVSDGIADSKVRKARARDAGRRVAIPLN